MRTLHHSLVARLARSTQRWRSHELLPNDFKQQPKHTDEADDKPCPTGLV